MTIRPLLALSAVARPFSQKLVSEEETLKNMERALKKEMRDHENMVSAAAEQLQDQEDSRAARVKNLSLSLLEVDSPIKVLDLFDREYLQQHQNNKEVYVEELFMLLHFFKATVREWQDDAARDLIRKDFRVNALVALIMDLYSGDVDFAYQVSTILSLTTLNSFYDLQLTDRWKDKLVEGLKETRLRSESDGSSFIFELPSLIFSL